MTGIKPTGQTARRADLRVNLGAYPHKRADVLKSLGRASPSVAQLGMSLKLASNRRQIVHGIKLALVNQRKASADKAIRSLGK
ncbi:MAG: hypothetical protein AAFV29_23635 [Myxococcota bacterium]